jgi:hypothetical protein
MADLLSKIPVGVLTDSYKAGHFLMYPDAVKMCAVRAPSPPDAPRTMTRVRTVGLS